MKPVDMIVRHAPPESIGDCFRCCIASLLELTADAVPHFMEEDWGRDTNFVWYPKLLKWLEPRGLSFIELNVAPEYHQAGRWFDGIKASGFDSFHMISGKSSRADHCVVGRNGVVVHDPAPQKDGLVGPHDDGFYTYGFLILRGTP